MNQIKINSIRKINLYFIQEIFFILIILFLALLIILRVNEIMKSGKTTEEITDETIQYNTTKTYDFPEGTSVEEQNKIILYDQYIDYFVNKDKE